MKSKKVKQAALLLREYGKKKPKKQSRMNGSHRRVHTAVSY